MNENTNGLQPEETLKTDEAAFDKSAAPCEDAEAAPETVDEGLTFSAELTEGAEELAAWQSETQPKKNVRLTLVVAALVALLAVAAIFLTSALKEKPAPQEDTVDPAPGTVTEEQPSDETLSQIVHENELGYTSYTMTEEQATDAVLSQIVASCGDWTLTNRELPYYYWEQYYSFANQYAQYLSYILDTSLPLDEQLYDETNTWQQQFLDAAVRHYGMIAAVCRAAELDGYVLDDDAEAQIAAIGDSLAVSAETYGYDSVDDIIRDAFGPTADLESYTVYMRRSMIASGYLNDQVEKMEYTLDDLSAYYDEHAEEYEAQYIQKVDKPMISVRHILIQPTETDEDGSFTDAAWEAAKTEVERIYAEWEASDHSEDTFAEMAAQYSVDGSSTNGGLYENVYPGQMVEEFNDWCFDDARQVADYGLVKTRFGYHIMFFSAVGDEIYWPTVVKEDYLNDQAALLLDDICARYPVTSTLENAALLPLPSETETDTEE